jgi:hypothetical protein
MKTQQEATIQFSGYPLSIVETQQENKMIEFSVIKSAPDFPFSFQKNSIANDPKNWDVDWFNSYE